MLSKNSGKITKFVKRPRKKHEILANGTRNNMTKSCEKKCEFQQKVAKKDKFDKNCRENTKCILRLGIKHELRQKGWKNKKFVKRHQKNNKICQKDVGKQEFCLSEVDKKVNFVKKPQK